MKNLIYSVVVSPKAQKEIEEILNYYTEKSEVVPANFIKALRFSYHLLSINPYFRVRYKNIRVLKINKFPYSLYFVINRNKCSVRILSCFHNKRNPSKI